MDGPAASGKSTIAQSLAAHLGYLYFDTGVMYRAVTLAALNSDISPHDQPKVEELARRVLIDVQPPSVDDGRQYDVLVNGEDVTWEIRLPAVDESVSEVSTYAEVRQAMTARQREIGQRGGVVMVGRDIGTVVLPDADLKIFLEATVEERARRRYEERLARGEQVEYDEVLESMRARDYLDSSRDLAPLRPAQDAVILDSTGLEPEEVVRQALDLVRKGTP